MPAIPAEAGDPGQDAGVPDQARPQAPWRLLGETVGVVAGLILAYSLLPLSGGRTRDRRPSQDGGSSEDGARDQTMR